MKVQVSLYVCPTMAYAHKKVRKRGMNPPTLLVDKCLLVAERLFSVCYQHPQTLKQRNEFKEKKVEDCTWTPAVDETMLKFFGIC